MAFELKQDYDIKYLAFSQRKYLGFRGRYEFDKKRILAAGKDQFSIFGYDHRKNVYELLRYKLDDSEN